MSAHLLVIAGPHYYPSPAYDPVFPAHTRKEAEEISKRLYAEHDYIVIFEIVHDGVQRFRMPTAAQPKIAKWEPIVGSA